MAGRCQDCSQWEQRQQDDSGTRYGKCDIAYEGADEACPWSDVLLAVEGPKHAREQVSAVLLTSERYGCIQFEARR
jgi:hypothetical protein